MGGLDRLSLRPGDYVITPSDRLREYDDEIGGTLSGGVSVEGMEGFHKFSVEDGAGRDVLEIHQHRVRSSGGVIGRALEDEYVFSPPGEEPALRLAVDSGWRTDYALSDATTDARLASWEKSGLVLGGWHLELPHRGHVATASWDLRLRDLALSSHGTYTMTGPEGGELGEFRHRRLEDTALTGLDLSELEVSLSDTTIPVPVCLAFAFGIYREAKGRSGKSSSTIGE